MEFSSSELKRFLNLAFDHGIRCTESLLSTASIWDENLGVGITLRDKAVAETLIFALLAKRHTSPSVYGTSLAIISKNCSLLARSAHRRALLLRYPSTAIASAICSLALTELGLPDVDFSWLVERVFSSAYFASSERLPYREMEVQWLASSFRTASPSRSTYLTEASIVRSLGHPIRMSIADCYALTHELMYLSDFGGKELPDCLPRTRLRRMLDSALAWNLLSENLDLLCELLMGVIFTGNVWSPYAVEAWQLIAETWTEFGFLPCPGLRSEEFRLLSGRDANSYALKHTYHTTFVGGMLCTLLLRYGSAAKFERFINDIDYGCQEIGREIDNAIRRVPKPLLPKIAEAANNFRAASVEGNRESSLSLLQHRMTECKSLEDPSGRRCVRSAKGKNDKDILVIVRDGLLTHCAQNYELCLMSRILRDVVVDREPVSETIVESIRFLMQQQDRNGLIGADLFANVGGSGELAAQATIEIFSNLDVFNKRLATRQFRSSSMFDDQGT